MTLRKKFTGCSAGMAEAHNEQVMAANGTLAGTLLKPKMRNRTPYGLLHLMYKPSKSAGPSEYEVCHLGLGQ